MREPHLKLPELRALRAFLQAASVTEAAQMLGVTQPAVSKALRQLEIGLGFALFERKAGRLAATKEAAALGSAVEDVFSSMAVMRAAVLRLRDQQDGHLTIGALPTLAHVCLPLALEAVRRRYPALRLSVEILTTLQIIERVERGLLDIGLVHDVYGDPPVEVEDIGATVMCCVVPQGHPLFARSRITPREIATLPLVSFSPDSPAGRRIAATFREAGAAFAPAIEVNASTALCTLAERAELIGLVEEYVLGLGWWPRLRPVPLHPPIPLRARIVTRIRRPISIAGKLFCDEYRRVVAGIMPTGKPPSPSSARAPRRRGPAPKAHTPKGHARKA